MGTITQRGRVHHADETIWISHELPTFSQPQGIGRGGAFVSVATADDLAVQALERMGRSTAIDLVVRAAPW